MLAGRSVFCLWCLEHQTALPDSRGGSRHAKVCCLAPGTSDYTPWLVAVRGMQKCVVWSLEHQTTLPDSRGGSRHAKVCCLVPGTSDCTPWLSWRFEACKSVLFGFWNIQTTLPDSRSDSRDAEVCCLAPGTSDYTPQLSWYSKSRILPPSPTRSLNVPYIQFTQAKHWTLYCASSSRPSSQKACKYYASIYSWSCK